MKREVIDFINDIIDAAGKVEKFTKGMTYEDFCRDDKTVFAVIRAIEVIGEAVKNIPDEIRNSYPEIPWKSMAGMRNKVIHQYFGVDLKVVWETVKLRIPEIKPQFEKILKNLQEGES